MSARLRAIIASVGLVAAAVPFSVHQFSPTAAGAPDGPPVVRSIWPQTSATAGGGVVRIYGTGLGGTTSVKFGTQTSPAFKVIDSNLVTAVVPAATVADNTSVDVTTTDDQGTSTHDKAAPAFAFLYTDASLSVSPASGLKPGADVTVSVTGWASGQSPVIAEINPLIGYVENGPHWTVGPPPPYQDQIASAQTSDGTVMTTIALMKPYSANQGYDDNDGCPVTPVTADHGLGRCAISFGAELPRAALTFPFSLTDDPVPKAPTLTVSSQVGGKVTLSGDNWNGSPLFGSGAKPDSPGQTDLLVQLCTADLTSCKTMASDATVAMTRYVDSDPASPNVQGRFSGATLSGTATVGDSSACGTGCVVQVTQKRADPLSGQPLEPALSAVATLNGGPLPDGAPVLSRFWPQSGPTAGGTPVRIYGSGFAGTAKVSFGTQPAKSFAVIDGNLLTAVAPKASGAGNAPVAITVTDSEGASKPAPGFLYTNASLTVDPEGGLSAGASTTVSVKGYQPSTSTVISEVSPLAAFLEGGPPPFAGTVPYADQLATTKTDAAGNSTSPVTLSKPFAGASNTYDANSACPPTKQQADMGLVNCSITYAAKTGGALTHAIRFTGQPIPTAPTLGTPPSAHLGDRIDIGGNNWSAAPLFGSSTTSPTPGQTKLTLDLCTAEGTCKPAQGTATVVPTRYVDSTSGDATVKGQLTGATLSGSIVVDNASGCFPDCYLRVRQQGFDADRGVAADDDISTRVRLILTDGPPQASGPWPQTASPETGGPVRIYGHGLRGTTSVMFGPQPAKFEIVDSDLIITNAPPGSANSSVAITVTDDEGTSSTGATFLYTDASLTVTPDTGLAPAGPATVDVKGYTPSVPGSVAEANPLIGFLENGPTPPAGKPPYRDEKASPITDAGGNASAAVQLSPAGAVGAAGYDVNSTCPVTQQAADFGLGRCAILFDQAGTSGLEKPISLNGDPTPAKPVLTLSPTGAFVGDTVTLGGTNWNAAPEFGSSSEVSNGKGGIGQSPVSVELCTADLGKCGSMQKKRATVSPTRYRDAKTGDGHVDGSLSGAELSGSFDVPDPVGCAPDCVVRVRQQRFDPIRRAPADDFVEATAPLHILADTAQSFVAYSPFSGATGTRVAFYGLGASSLTGVDFGGVAGAGFRIEPDGLATVAVPSGPSGLVDLTLHGGPNEGAAFRGGFFVFPTDFSYTVEPRTNLHPGDVVRITLHHYVPNTPFVVPVLVSPLVNFSEPPPGVVPVPQTGPPDQAWVLTPFGTTDAEGNLVLDETLPKSNVKDPQARCPVPQKQANAGLTQCILSISVFARGIVEVPLSYADDKVPENPSLSLRTRNAKPGDSVQLDGFAWHGNPHFGSSTKAGSLRVDVCGIDGNPNKCQPAGGDVTVQRTRYFYDPANPAGGKLEGADLSGSITVPDIGTNDCGGCFVRVHQDVAGTSTVLEATSPLSVKGQPKPLPGTTTSSSTSTTTSSTTTTTQPPRTTPRGNSDVLRGGPSGPNAAGGILLSPPVQPALPGGGGGVAPSPAPSPGAAPSPAAAPSPGAAAVPAPGNPVTSPAAGAQQQRNQQAAPEQGHLMVRRDDGTSIAMTVALSSAGVAAGGIGCVIALATTGAVGSRRRRQYDNRRRPRPRGAY